jgi:broad specificity phosphatase PhoE
MSFIVVRHGPRDDKVNPHKYKNITDDTPLSEEGFLYVKKKAEELSIELNKLNITITKIISSPYLRTLQTAEIYQQTLNIKNEIEEDIMLCEGQNYHPPRGMSHKILEMMEEKKILYPETLEHINERCNELVRNLDKKETYLLITHGIIWNNIVKIVHPIYTYVDEKDPSKYIPHYCDVAIYDVNLDKIIYSTVKMNVK